MSIVYLAPALVYHFRCLRLNCFLTIFLFLHFSFRFHLSYDVYIITTNTHIHACAHNKKKIGVAAVAGVFCLLGLGMVMGIVILIFEHWFYKYALPSLRLKPKGTIWRSRNIMFFSQKLYRFINCVELVSPHHAARELVHSIRQGQIASLFQKSIKRVRIRFSTRFCNLSSATHRLMAMNLFVRLLLPIFWAQPRRRQQQKWK